jgi:hypothetical protein
MNFDGNADSALPGHPSRDKATANVRPRSGLTGRRRLLMSATVALSAFVVVAGLHAAAADARGAESEAPQPSASIPEETLWRNQDRLSDLRDWTEALPGIKNSGYITLINEAADGSTILVWHGPPEPVQRQIMAEAQRRRIPISIQHRKHSIDDLERAVNQLSAVESGTDVFKNFDYDGIGTLSIDFDGVTIQGDYINAPTEGVAAADAALTKALTAKTGVATKIEHVQIELLN